MGQSFEDLDVWKISCRLAVSITQNLYDCKVFALRDQMIRSAISIPSNIAEGAERYSVKDFKRFLGIALGSAAELRTQVYIGKESGVLAKDSADEWIEQLKSISKMIQSLVKSLDRKL